MITSFDEGQGTAIRRFLLAGSSPHDDKAVCEDFVARSRYLSNYIPQFTVGCNYLSLHDKPATDNKVLISFN